MKSRPLEPFHRFYSPPEPPPTAERPTLFGVVTVAAGAVLAVATGFLLGFGGGSEAAGHANKASVGGGSGPEPGTGSPATDRSTLLYGSVPAPCGGVTEATLGRLLHRWTTSRSANTSLAICTFTSTSDESRRLRIETRVFPPEVSAAPVADAGAFFGTRWDRAHREAASRTISLERFAGPADEGYRWSKRDDDRPAVVAEVAVRLRNAVITVGYGGGTPSKEGSAQSDRGSLSDATAVVSEVLATFR